MSELKHADVIVHMAQNGFDSVEGRYDGGCTWGNSAPGYTPVEYSHHEWRIKPATITYTVTVPEPMRVMPEIGQGYWFVSSTNPTFDKWQGHPIDLKRFKLGNCFDTEAKAQAAFDALFGPLKAKE